MNLKNSYYILRHGDTEYQSEKTEEIYPRDCTDKIPLSEKGRKKVLKTAEKIKALGIDKIYSSDFLRTKQTAELVKSKLRNVEIVFDEMLRDMDLGVWHEEKKKDFYDKFPIKKERYDKRPEEGESWREVEERMKKVLVNIEKEENGTILIVSHGDPLWILEGCVKGISKEKLMDIKREKKKFIKPAELRRLN